MDDCQVASPHAVRTLDPSWSDALCYTCWWWAVRSGSIKQAKQSMTSSPTCCATGKASNVAEWKEVLSEAQMCEQLAKGRKPMRTLLLHIYGGHTAYHDAKAHTRLTQAHKVGLHNVWGGIALPSLYLLLLHCTVFQSALAQVCPSHQPQSSAVHCWPHALPSYSTRACMGLLSVQ